MCASPNLHPLRIFIFQPILHSEPEQRQAVSRSRSRPAEDAPEMLVQMRKTKPHQQRITQHLSDMKTGEQSTIVKVLHDFMPCLQMMNYLLRVIIKRLRSPPANRSG